MTTEEPLMPDTPAATDTPRTEAIPMRLIEVVGTALYGWSDDEPNDATGYAAVYEATKVAAAIHRAGYREAAATPQVQADPPAEGLLREALHEEQRYSAALSEGLLRMGHHPIGHHQSPNQYDADSALACPFDRCLAALAATPAAKPEAGVGLPSATDLDTAAVLLYKVGNGATFGPTSQRLATRLAYHLNGQREPAAYAEAASPRSDAGVRSCGCPIGPGGVWEPHHLGSPRSDAGSER